MGQSRPLICVFASFSRHNSNIKWKNHNCCARGSNPGPSAGRHRQIHWAMATPLSEKFVCCNLSMTEGSRVHSPDAITVHYSSSQQQLKKLPIIFITLPCNKVSLITIRFKFLRKQLLVMHVAQLVPTPEVLGSNPVTSNNLNWDVVNHFIPRLYLFLVRSSCKLKKLINITEIVGTSWVILIWVLRSTANFSCIDF